MSEPCISNGAEFTGPTEYRIVVRGRLEEWWRDRVGGLQMTIHEGPGQPVETELTGSLPDQAALMGILHHLYARGIAIVSVGPMKHRSETGS